MKPCLRLDLKPTGDYPDCKCMGNWGSLCATQQRAFHGQSADPSWGNVIPNYLTRLLEHEKNICLWIMYGGGVMWYDMKRSEIISLQSQTVLQLETQTLSAYGRSKRKHADDDIHIEKTHWETHIDKYSLKYNDYLLDSNLKRDILAKNTDSSRINKAARLI